MKHQFYASTILFGSILISYSIAFGPSIQTRRVDTPFTAARRDSTCLNLFFDLWCGEEEEEEEDKKDIPSIKTRFKERVGTWLPRNVEDLEPFLTAVIENALLATKNNAPLIPPIRDLKTIVMEDVVLQNNVENMFKEAEDLQKTQTPLNTPAVESFDQFLQMLNLIIQTAPAFYTMSDQNPNKAELIAFPINAILAFPMATNSGYAVFSNSLINQQLKKILNAWSIYLESEASAYVLTADESSSKNVLGAPLIPWLDERAKKQVIDVAFQYTGNPAPSNTQFENIFESNPDDPNFGFKSWDNFFVKKFVPGVRPVGGPKGTQIWADSDRVILNACESAPLPIKTNAKLSDKFWVKDQPYSIENILDFDKRARLFDGGTIYQAFLSGLSYHRWHSPVRGKVVKTAVVSGTYYLENFVKGFNGGLNSNPDEAGPNDSQQFISAVATRGLIFIEADGPIGLMCFVAIGMAEVSSIDIIVEAGQYIEKGQEIGMFHYGGSSHCMLFRKNVNLDFSRIQNTYHTGPFGYNSTNVPVRAQLARVLDDSPEFRSFD